MTEKKKQNDMNDPLFPFYFPSINYYKKSRENLTMPFALR